MIVNQTGGSESPDQRPNGSGRSTIAKKAALVLTLGAILVFLILRWNSFEMPFDRDEGEYAYSAWLMNHGAMPYHDSFLQKPPLIIYVYRVAQYFSEDSVIPPRILASLSLAVTMVVLGIIAFREYGFLAAMGSMWLMAGMLTLKILTPYSANTEVFLILPLLVLVLLYVWYGADASSVIWLLAGLCAALTLLFKPIALVIVLFILIVWAVERFRAAGDMYRLAKKERRWRPIQRDHYRESISHSRLRRLPG